jgi:hypothetical protein
MRNSLISLPLWMLGALGVASVVASACSAPDPGVSYPISGATSTIGVGTSAPASSEDAGAPATGSGSGSGGAVDSGGGTAPTGAADAGTSDAGSAAGGEAGNDGGGALAGFLGETTPWASNLPTPTAFSAHTGAGVPQQTPTLDCLTCHVTGGAGVPFLGAGFVATAAGGTTGAADVEVRVYATGGTPGGYSAHTDANGYFWINPPLGGTTGPYNAGARNETDMQMMPTSQTVSDCQSSSCHGGGTVGNIHLP